MNRLEKFIEKIHTRKCVVGVIGMGYVGLPLALEFCKAGFKVIGFDLDEDKIEKLNRGKSYIKHIDESRIAKAKSDSLLDATADFEKIKETDAVMICVPTPLTGHREPDLSYITTTAETINRFIHREQLVTLESTTYPGTTEEILTPILEKGSGLKAGEDFWVAFSPEREDPNNPKYKTADIPKVVGGLTEECRDAACSLYGQIFIRTVPVSSCAAAEATKLVENIFRSVNIAMVNELKMIFHKMNIDIWEVIKAAESKPFGFMPFYPGPGLGGHCIPIDPFYLTWKAKEFGITTRFIELAGEINTSMPDYVIFRTMEALNQREKALKGAKLLIVGLAYKDNVDDMRESPSLVLIDRFEAKGATVAYHDPYIPVIPKTREHYHLAGRESVELESAANFDVAVIATRHSNIDYDYLQKNCPLIIDTRNAYPDNYPNVEKA